MAIVQQYRLGLTKILCNKMPQVMRSNRAGLRAVLVATALALLMLSCASASQRSDSTISTSPTSDVSVVLTTDYPHANGDCDNLGAKRLSYAVSPDRELGVLDLGDDGAIDGTRIGSTVFIRASAFNLDATEEWIRVDLRSGGAAVPMIAGTTVEEWSFGLLEESAFDPFAIYEASRQADPTASSVQLTEDGPELSWETDGSGVIRTARLVTSTDLGDVETTTHRTPERLSDLEGVAPPERFVRLGELSVRDLIFTRADIRPECERVIPGAFDDARRACAENVTRGYTVQEWVDTRQDLGIGC